LLRAAQYAASKWLLLRFVNTKRAWRFFYVKPRRTEVKTTSASENANNGPANQKCGRLTF